MKRVIEIIEEAADEIKDQLLEIKKFSEIKRLHDTEWSPKDCIDCWKSCKEVGISTQELIYLLLGAQQSGDVSISYSNAEIFNNDNLENIELNSFFADYDTVAFSTPNDSEQGYNAVWLIAPVEDS